MQDAPKLYNRYAPTRAVAHFDAMLRAVGERAHGLPGIGVFYGPSGYGKTTAALYAANVSGACLVQMRSVWSAKNLYAAILEELGVRPARTIADMLRQIAEELAVSDRALIIDEADVLVRRKSIEAVRDLYESSYVPVILVGEESLPQMLRRWERVHGRVIRWAAAEAANRHDYDQLRKLRCPDINIADPVRDALMAASKGSVRRIVVNLDLVAEKAALTGAHAMTDPGAIDWHTGEAPSPRRGLG